MIEISLTKGKTAYIDEGDAILAENKWTAHGGGYAYRMMNRQCILMHRAVMERMLGRPLIKGEYVDHINRERTDNRRCNLRLATNRQNAMNAKIRIDNTTGYKGIYKHKRGGTKVWSAYIQYMSKRISLGYYETAEEAAKAYNNAAIELYGDFAGLNVIPTPHQ